jgi:hypothetical protein
MCSIVELESIYRSNSDIRFHDYIHIRKTGSEDDD